MNRANLPLIGRDDELRRILDFWRSTPDWPGLRACALIGEAGIGKSRLIDEAVAMIPTEEGTIIQVRLYPDSPLALAPIILDSLQHHEGLREAARQPSERERQNALRVTDIGTVSSLLRRHSHFRPTLLVLDDIHLLAGEPLREFSTLVEQLTDEPLWILCATRPTEGGGRPILERALIDEILLERLGREHIIQIWDSMFGISPDDALVDSIANETLGNPLAMRSALRGAVSSGAIVRTGAGGWRLNVPIPALTAALRRHVGYLAGSMTVGLERKEIDDLRSLALLGEIFAVESAQLLLGPDSRSLGRLIDAGIIATAPIARTPITGEASSHPLLVFTHSLLHHSLIRTEAVNVRTIIRLMSGGAPFYSLHPIRILAQCVPSDVVDDSQAASVIPVLITSALAINATPDWEMGGPLCDAADALARTLPSISTELRGELMRARLEMIARDPTSTAHIDLSRRLLDLVSTPSTKKEGELFLHALRNGLWRRVVRDSEDPASLFARVGELLERFPSLRATDALLEFLRAYSRVLSSAKMPYSNGRDVDTIFQDLIDDTTLRPDVRRKAWRNRAISLAWLFESASELAERRQLLEEVAMEGSDPETEFLAMLIVLYDNTGEYRDARQWIERSLPLLRRRGQIYLDAGFRCMLIWQEAPFARDLDRIGQRLLAIESTLPEAMAKRLHRNIIRQLVMIAGLREDLAFIRRLAETDSLEQGDLAILQALGCGIDIDLDRGAAVVDTLATDGIIASTIGRIIAEGLVDDDSIATLRGTLLSMPLRLSADLYRRGVIAVVAAMKDDRRRRPLFNAISKNLVRAIHLSLEFQSEKGFPLFMETFLERWRDMLGEREYRRWKERIEELTSRSDSIQEKSLVKVSVIGTIQILRPDGVVVRPRTGRVRKLVALMIADRLLARPLTPADFHRLMDEQGDDSERGRKGMNLAVHRLREAVGKDLILTDRDTPRLNSEMTRVDLLEVDQLLKNGMEEMRGGFYGRARIAVEEGLRLINGEVAFAGLYDDFFEGMRAELENRVRTTIAMIARRLIDEKVFDQAVALLERGLEAIPTDGELTEILGIAYERSNRHAEAAAMRSRK